jgi:hypothetical protein
LTLVDSAPGYFRENQRRDRKVHDLEKDSHEVETQDSQLQSKLCKGKYKAPLIAIPKNNKLYFYPFIHCFAQQMLVHDVTKCNIQETGQNNPLAKAAKNPAIEGIQFSQLYRYSFEKTPFNSCSENSSFFFLFHFRAS